MKRQFRRRLAALSVMVVLPLGAAVGLATSASAADATATFAKVSDWGSGFEGQYTIRNTGSTTIDGWRLEVDFPSGTTVGTYWNALMTSSGNHYTFTHREYNRTLAPGASTTFGFIGNGSGSPANCRLNGASCAGGGDPGDVTPPTAPSNLRATGTTSSSVSLAWNASTDNRGVAGYDVYQGSTKAAGVTGTSATVGDLSPDTSYTFTVRARDAAGNVSAASNAVTARTQPGPPPPPPGTLRVAPYVDMGAWPTPSMTEMARASGLKGFTMAFVVGGACRASWFGAYDPRTAWMKNEVDGIRAAGGDVKISFGGASGVELAQVCTTVDSLAAEYKAVVDAYGLKYIDLDIEGAATADPVSVNRRSAALKKVQDSTPGLRVSLTLPVLPSGLTADGLSVVRSARDHGVNLDLVNVMAMDYYQRGGGTMGEKAVQAAQSTHDQLAALYPGRSDAALWRMVGVTPMLGVNDSQYEVFELADARGLVQFAQQTHLGILAFWEMTRDRNACNGPLYRCTNIPQQPYDFSKIFAGYRG